MLEEILLISSIVQWVVIVFGCVLILALLRVVGSISSTQHDSQHTFDEVSLKGVNIGGTTVHDARLGLDVPVSSVLGGQPALLVVTDPSCHVCDERLRSLQDGNIPLSRVIVAVRATKEAAAQLAGEMPPSIRIVVEDVHLGLRAFKPPFATVLDDAGTYTSFLSLREASDVQRLPHLLSNEEARQRMSANYAQLEEVGMVSSGT